jgi:pSer/pThr/pTyr-binding forkhead associated (FHA) protein
MAKLVVISDEMKDRTFELTKERVTVGRIAENDIFIENSAISSRHAELIRKGDDYIVHDLNSTNGTRVNGQRVVETRLYHGDSLMFGHFELQYQSSAKAGQTLPAPSRRSVDLNSSVIKVNTPPATFNKTSPFGKQSSGSKFKKIFQVSMLVLGLIVAVLLTLIIIGLMKA